MDQRYRLTFGLCLTLAWLAGAAHTQDEQSPTRLRVSGRYPELAVYNHQGECGIGVVVDWAGKLWFQTYSPHEPLGSDDKLWTLDRDFQLQARAESVGGTPAGRWLHYHTGKMLIGHHLIDRRGRVQTISPEKMPARVTAIAEHLTDPAGAYYVLDMEGRLYEVDIRSLEPKLLFEKPVPGWHAKAMYRYQTWLVVANNGEHPARRFEEPPYLVGSDPVDPEDAGVLAEWDGENWSIVKRRQFAEITTVGDVRGRGAMNATIWTLGWDRRSVMFDIRHDRHWWSYRLPKSDFSYDGRHGWYTEWPRIRRLSGASPTLMTMHGGMFEFDYRTSNEFDESVRPLNAYLKVVSDFADWQGECVFGCDDAAKLGNPFVNQSHSNLWFTPRAGLAELGRPRGWGGPWLGDDVKAGAESDPYLFAGYLERCVHLHHGASEPVRFVFEAGGSGGYTEVATIEVPAGAYVHREFPADLPGTWIRVRVEQDAPATTVRFHYGPGGGAVTDPKLFRDLARVDRPGSRSIGLVRPRGNDLGTMHLLATQVGSDGTVGEPTYYEMGPDLQLAAKPDDAETASWLAENAAIDASMVTIDAASVVFERGGERYRLPKGRRAFDALYQADAPGGPPRAVREVVTERSLLHAHGSFYVLPRDDSAGPAGLMPVASHEYRIHDFMSWRGLLVMTGVRADARTDVQQGGHVCSAGDGTAVWVGDVDDLWKLGKPVGVGGPWAESPVKAGVPSDRYLMTGYDQKKVALSHDAAGPVTMRLEVDVALDGHWLTYAEPEVPAGETVEHVFPDGYHAHWIRVVADRDCRASAQFVYE